MTGRNDRDSRRTVQMSPAKSSERQNKATSELSQKRWEKRNTPFAFIVNDKLEYTMAIRSAELDRVFPGGIFDWRECDADVRVKHGELELEVFDSRVGLPSAFVWIEFRYVCRIYLWFVKSSN